MLHRILARYLKADLNPPLGKPGGPCQVVKRIEDEVHNPGLKQDLIEDVEQGKSLSNPEAAKVYPIDREPGVGPIKQVQISSHAQYRMDLRSVTVQDVRNALGSLLQQMGEWKSKRDTRYMQMSRALDMQDKIEWVNPKTKLLVVFVPIGGGAVTLISAYWKGVPDPLPPKSCGV